MKDFRSHPLLIKLIPEKRGRMWIWILFVALAGLLALLLDRRESQETTTSLEPESVETASTFIPAGYVLVPIEVANYESLDSILGKFGVVDLYTLPLDPRDRPKKIATRIKILRAPLNPNHFAVLAPEDQSQTLVGFSGPLTVVVQNPKSTGTGIVKGLASAADSPNTKLGRSTRSARKLSRVTIEVSHVENPNESPNEPL